MICAACERPLEMTVCRSFETLMTTFCCICNKRLSREFYATLGSSVWLFVKICAGREDFPGGIGVRPSWGAAMSASRTAWEISDALVCANAAAPEDGRAPRPRHLEQPFVAKVRPRIEPVGI